jgi:hypothetical protein
MPWSCPACRTQIHHGPLEDRPRLNSLYRCHVCRLELILDPDTGRLRVAPMRDEDLDRKQRRT